MDLLETEKENILTHKNRNAKAQISISLAGFKNAASENGSSLVTPRSASRR